jgi:hypothetical protein
MDDMTLGPHQFSRDMDVEDRWIFEVKDGVVLFFGERTALSNGWWFTTPDADFGPFRSCEEALDAAGNAPDVILCPTDEQPLVH